MTPYPVAGSWDRPTLERFLAETVVPVRLGCHTPRGWPLVMSLWYLYRDGALWCATSPRARLVRLLERDPRCAFEVAADTPPYRGARGPADAELVRDHHGALLGELIDRYLGSRDSGLARRLLARAREEVVIRLAPRRFFTWDYAARMADATRRPPR